MKRTIFSAMVFLGLVISIASAAEWPVVTLWPKGLPAGAAAVDSQRAEKLKAENTDERFGYVDQPSLTILPATAEKANGCAVVICPGGGYNILAWNKEGIEIGEWFNSIGVTAAVLKYRVPRRDPETPHREPLQDAQRAIRVVRQHAEEWKIDPSRVGILGFSAGGHLTVMAGLNGDSPSYDKVDAADDLSCRPDFMCPIYAAYLGEKYADDVAQLGSLVNVTKETPPTFLAVTGDDRMRGAQAALLFVELNKLGVPAEVHVYTKGGHGYGIRPFDQPVATWHERCGQWLQASGFLTKK